MSYHHRSILFGPGALLATSFVLLGLLLCCQIHAADSNLVVRIMAANLTGNSQVYGASQIRILQGLKPDVVALQEFQYGDNSDAAIRGFVDTAFGTNFAFFREPAYSLPNGVISRYPIRTSGSWADAEQSQPNRGFAWAQIALPGTNELYVVSVHLLSSAGASARAAEATALKALIQSNFPAGANIVVAGDLNTDSRSESAVTTFKTFLSDSPIPTDAESGGNQDTNEPRNKPYDYVLPSPALASRQVAAAFASHSFANGLVFDSRVYTPLTDVPPVLVNDSADGQHMAVMKDFSFTIVATNTGPVAPWISLPPLSQSVAQGSSAAFTVTASGTAPMSYQWRFNGTNISGATTNSYTRANVQPADAGSYTMVVSNVAGSVTSTPAVLTVTTTLPGIIAQWNFNSATPDGSTTTGSSTPSSGTGTASLVGGTTAAFATGDTALDPAGSTDNSGWNTTTYPASSVSNKSAGVKFSVSTAGRQNISVSWSDKASSTGGKYFRLQFTTNGTAWQDFPTAATVSSSVFTAHTNSLAAFAGVSDNTNFAFRIVAEFESTATGTGTAGYVAAGGTYGTSGTVRFDMVTVYGATIPTTPATPAVLSQPAMDANRVLRFNVTGQAGANYIVQAATNLSGAWWPIQTNRSPFAFAETNTTSFPQRFYRALSGS